MPKLLVILVNLFALLAYNLFFGGDVVIEQKFPQQVQAGETLEVEIVIEKGDRDGFAKWNQALPEGFIAEAKDAKGGTFSFKNQEVKVIWMSIPKDEKFSIYYTVKIDPETQGQFDINGKFSYIENNDRQDVITQARKLEVLAEGTAIAVKDENIENETAEEEVAKEEDPMPKNEEKAEDATASSSNTNSVLAYSDEDVTIERMVIEKDPSEYEVTLTIKKGDLNSFGKIEEFIPENFVASTMENSDGMFSFRDDVMKILWMTLPSDETIVVKYNLKSMAAGPKSGEITGMFSFLDVDESKQVELNGLIVNNTFGSDGVMSDYLAETEEKVEEATNDIEEEPMTEEEVIEEEVAEVEAAALENVEETNVAVAETIAVVESDFPSGIGVKSSFFDKDASDMAQEDLNEIIPTEKVEENYEEQLVAEITNIPAPESNVNYKVQIAAGKKEVKQQYFVSRHNISEQVDIEYHEGWYKYTLGGYSIYKQARDRRNEIWEEENNINDAFVTAYNSGERISVQEALMITKQKWYK